ncbi:S8 family serine peptidase [Rhodovibrio sodomensis]|nr:S8 family serine peptidase [Rhodovibrio sodomensis]
MFSLGAKAEKVTPEVVLGKTDKREPRDAPTIFAAVKRKTLRSFSENLTNWQPSSKNIADDFRKIEDVRAPKLERLKIEEINVERNYPLEVVLHIGIPGISDEIYEAFEAFSAKLNAEVLSDRVRTIGELTFVPVRCPGESLRSLCEFSLIRSIRVMPKVRMGQTALRSVNAPPFQPTFPTGPVLDPTIKTAVFDGGLPNNPHPLTQWAQEYSTPNLGSPDQSAQEHGTAVTCAALFGSLQNGTTPPQPFSSIRHYRVIDHNPVHDFDLVDILHRITKTLDHENFDFLNISMGPDIPIDDDDINVWTATLDKYAFQQQCFVSIACGNSGEEDHTAGNTRIQPASDGVNVVGIGASDKASGEWGRASYSSVGPGRSPRAVQFFS